MASIGGLGKEIRLAGLLAKTPFKIIRSLKKKKGMYMGAGGTNGPSRGVGGTG